MSAWDVTGAAASGAWVLFFLCALFSDTKSDEQTNSVKIMGLTGFFFGIPWLSFCIARLCGAHL